jgi:hypothetical protein
MNQQTYSLLITVIGAVITGIFGLINTLITVRAKRGQRVEIERSVQGKSIPTEHIPRQGHPHMLLFTVLIGVGAAAGFFIGNATKDSPSIVRHYNQEEQISVSRERIAEIEHEIQGKEQEKERIMMEPALPEPEKEGMIRELDERINQLRMERAEFEKIAEHRKIPEEREHR